MNERKSSQQLTSVDAEEKVKRAVASIFRHCSTRDNPVLAFSRACSKVGYLARDGSRGNLSHLESALNEQKHSLIMQRLGKLPEAHKHAADRDRHLRSFATGVRRELVQARESPSTPETREHRNLNLGQEVRRAPTVEAEASRGAPRKGLELPRAGSKSLGLDR